jgi:hypothetical protein
VDEPSVKLLGCFKKKSENEIAGYLFGDKV